MEEESKLKLMSEFSESLHHSVQIIEKERKAKLENDMEASELQQKLHDLERQLEEDRISRRQDIHEINTQIEGLKNCNVKKERADFNSAMAATISKDLKLIKEETRNLCIENVSIRRELEKRDVIHVTGDNLISQEREKDVDRMTNVLTTEMSRLKEDLTSLQDDIEGVKSLTVSYQAIGSKYEQEMNNLISQCEALEIEKLEIGVKLAQIKPEADLITADNRKEKNDTEVSNLELQLGKEKCIEEKLRQEFEKLQKEKDTMECLIKNSNAINANIASVRQEGSERQIELQNLMDQMEAEENKWLEEKNNKLS